MAKIKYFQRPFCITFASEVLGCNAYWRFLHFLHIFRNARLGNKGVSEVQTHPFFKNDQWDFHNIRDCVPPIVCELSGDDDTRNFDDVENETPSEDFPTPKAFAGNHLPFVGFTYSKDYQLLSGAHERPPPPIPGRVRPCFDHFFIIFIFVISRNLKDCKAVMAQR